MRNYNDYFIEKFLKDSLDEIENINSGKLLDLGCGSLPYARIYKNKFSECFAGDFTQRSENIDLILDAQSLPFRDGSFDVVIFCEVIEHIPNAEKALSEISRILRPGGVLLITWPYLYMLHETPHDYVRYSEFGMDRVLSESGLKIEFFFRRGGVFSLLFIIFEFLCSGVLEFFARVSFFGGVFGKIKRFLISPLFKLSSFFYFRYIYDGTFAKYTKVGEGLTGWKGHLNHWTLGYCAVVRKLAR